MQGEIAESDFVEILTAAARSTTNFMARLTDYHGGPIQTEYILTADVARAFLEKDHEVKVEYLNRRLVNGITQREGWVPKRALGSQRTDVVVMFSGLVPSAMVEVKIGVGSSLETIRDDLDKMAATIDGMKANVAANVRAASLFQVHVPGRTRDEIGTDRLKKRINEIEDSLRAKIKEYSPAWPEFGFRLVSLQGQTEGYVPTSVEYDDEGAPELGQTGHATRYYAVLLSSLR